MIDMARKNLSGKRLTILPHIKAFIPAELQKPKYALKGLSEGINMLKINLK